MSDSNVACTTTTGRRIHLALNFTWTAAETRAEVDRAIAQHKHAVDAIAAVPIEDVSYANTLEALSHANVLLEHLNAVLCIRQDFDEDQGDEDAREARGCAVTEAVAMHRHTAFRLDVFARIRALHAQLSSLDCSENVRAALERVHRAGVRRGLLLDEKARVRLQALETRLSELSQSVYSGDDDTNDTMELSSAELVGVPHDFLHGLADTDGVYTVPVTIEYVGGILAHCSSTRTRELAWRRFALMMSRSAVFDRALEAAAMLRERALILGYASHGEYVAELTIAKVAHMPTPVLDAVYAHALPMACADMQELAAVKAGTGSADALMPWDVMYYGPLKDAVHIRRCFAARVPACTTVFKALETCGGLFGLQFERVRRIPPPLRWCAQLHMYAVVDVATDDVIGVLYLDLWTRPGKTRGAWTRSVRHRTLVNGKETLPCVLVSCDMRPEQTSFSHFNMFVLLHELGHAIHALCARGTFPETASFAGEVDFMEMPSQLLENWAWDVESLVQLSGGTLPRELAEAVAQRHTTYIGRRRLLQVLATRLDGVLCGPGPLPETAAELAAAIAALKADACAVAFMQDVDVYLQLQRFVHGDAGTAHRYLRGNLDSAAVFHALFRHDADGKPRSLLDPAVAEAGTQYRQRVLEPGATRGAADMLAHALGRSWWTVDAALVEM